MIVEKALRDNLRESGVNLDGSFAGLKFTLVSSVFFIFSASRVCLLIFHDRFECSFSGKSAEGSGRAGLGFRTHINPKTTLETSEEDIDMFNLTTKEVNQHKMIRRFEENEKLKKTRFEKR